jgi:hypothetical protein
MPGLARFSLPSNTSGVRKFLAVPKQSNFGTFSRQLMLGFLEEAMSRK